MYEIISHKQNLGACILRIIAKSASAATINNTTSSSSTATTGISFDVLRLQVRSKSKFKHVTKETIALSIRMLIENSDVFEPSKNRYLPL